MNHSTTILWTPSSEILYNSKQWSSKLKAFLKSIRAAKTTFPLSNNVAIWSTANKKISYRLSLTISTLIWMQQILCRDNLLQDLSNYRDDSNRTIIIAKIHIILLPLKPTAWHPAIWMSNRELIATINVIYKGGKVIPLGDTIIRMLIKAKIIQTFILLKFTHLTGDNCWLKYHQQTNMCWQVYQKRKCTGRVIDIMAV